MYTHTLRGTATFAERKCKGMLVICINKNKYLSYLKGQISNF